MSAPKHRFLTDVWQSNEMKAEKEKFYAGKDNGSKTLDDDPSLREWKYWRLIKNMFIYDNIADKHDMIVSKRIFPDVLDATKEELLELKEIKIQLAKEGEYHVLVENLPGVTRSIKNHCHLHVIGKKMRV